MVCVLAVVGAEDGHAWWTHSFLMAPIFIFVFCIVFIFIYYYFSLLAPAVDPVPSPSKPIVLHINISTVNVTWSWEGYGAVKFLVQVSVGTTGHFVNVSQTFLNSFLIYGDMSVNEVYIFKVFAYQNGVASAPSPTSDLLINGVNGECSPELGGMKLLEENLPSLTPSLWHVMFVCMATVFSASIF